MDKLGNLVWKAHKLLESETDLILINQLTEVIEEAFALGLQDGMKVNWQEHDN